MKTRQTILITTVIVVLSSCQLWLSAEQEVIYTIEDYIECINTKGNKTAVRKYCRGPIKEELSNLYSFLELANDDSEERANVRFKEVHKVAFLPDYSDVALALVKYEQGEMTYLLHQELSNQWKIYYIHEGDYTELIDFITADSLAELGIFTVSDSELDDLLEY